MDTDYPRQATDLLNKIKYATIATATKDGRPWNSPVAFYIDTKPTLYWASDRNSQHSQNIRNNENIFIVIYDSTVSENEGLGLYIEAKGYELCNPEEIKYARRIKNDTNNDYCMFLGEESSYRIYKSVPQHIWVNSSNNTEGHGWRNIRIEVSLFELKLLLANK